MNRVIKSELIKYFSGKMIYITTILVFLQSILDYGATKLITLFNPEEVPELAQRFSNMSSQDYLLSSLLGVFTGGSIFIIITIVLANMISEDYGRGTMKYSLLATTREKLILGKIFTVGIINFLFMTATLVGAGAIGFIVFEWDSTSYSIIQILGAYGLGWLTLCGFSCMIVFAISKISKVSGAIGMGIGISMAIGIIGMIIPPSLKPLMISTNFSRVLEMSLGSWTEVLFTGGLYIIVFSILSVIVFRKKEILY